MNIKRELEKTAGSDEVWLNDLEIDPLDIRAVMINEVVPLDPAQDFYGGTGADYLKTTIPLFQKANAEVAAITDILKMGIYITNAVKKPKTESTVEKSSMEISLPYLERELALFPNVRVIMLMGDVAKKMFNRIAKMETGKNVIPSISTYKLRNEEFFYRGIRVFPSYIMTGGNVLIEKSKVEMAAEDIAKMIRLIENGDDVRGRNETRGTFLL